MQVTRQYTPWQGKERKRKAESEKPADGPSWIVLSCIEPGTGAELVRHPVVFRFSIPPLIPLLVCFQSVNPSFMIPQYFTA
jgi:hypothetical protein